MENSFVSGMNRALAARRSDSESEAPSIEDFDPDGDSGSDFGDVDSDGVVVVRKKKKRKRTWRYTLLPEDARRRDAECDQEARDEANGYDPHGPCELCRLVDETAEVYPKSLEEFYDYEKVQSKRVPLERLDELLTVKFNDVCYSLDRDTGGKANVQKMTLSMIRRHRDETLALPHRAVELLTEQIDFLRNSMMHIRRSEMWDVRTLDGSPAGPVRSHSSGWVEYARAWKLLKEAIELREKLLKSSESENGKGKGYGFKGKASFKYLSFKPC